MISLVKRGDGMKKDKEIDKLSKKLTENGFSYQRNINSPYEGINQILLEGEFRRFSIISHPGSYGYEQGLLECYNFLDEPTGYLTADEAYEWITKEVAE